MKRKEERKKGKKITFELSTDQNRQIAAIERKTAAADYG